MAVAREAKHVFFFFLEKNSSHLKGPCLKLPAINVGRNTSDYTHVSLKLTQRRPGAVFLVVIFPSFLLISAPTVTVFKLIMC